MNIYTFWEPADKMPDYLKLCMETWKMFLPNDEIFLLDYSNIGKYIDLNRYNKRLFDGTFSLPQIGDAVRSMLLEEYGGLWMDVDTILLNDGIKQFIPLDKDVSFFGNPERKLPHIAWINTKPHTPIMSKWVEYNIDKIENFVKPEKDFWAYLGNLFVTPYVQNNPEEVVIFDSAEVMPELSIGASNPQTYVTYYFNQSLHLKDIKVPMICLHNSWTPKMFKEMSANVFLNYDCTISNVLSEVLEWGGKESSKSKVYYSGNSASDSNKYILHRADGSVVYNPTIPGLNVTFKGSGGTVEIFEPCNQFEASNIICGTGAHISIKGSQVLQKAHGLNINAGAKNSVCNIGRDFSCWNIYITLIDEEGLAVNIGDDGMFSEGINLRPSDAHVIFDRKTRKKLNCGENIVIGNHVWIGKNVQIGKGAIVPSNTVVASNSKVTKKFISEYTVIGGIPAKLLKCDVDWDRVSPDLWNE